MSPAAHAADALTPLPTSATIHSCRDNEIPPLRGASGHKMAAQTWDVFVSYARADDEPPFGASRGWVTTLADELRKMLRRKLGVRDARVFMDHQLAGNEGLTSGLLEKVRESRTLVLLISPGYLKSQWCQWELGKFLEAQTERNHRDHVFVIETEPLDRESWPPHLRELIPIRFWHREFEDKASRLMGFPVPTLDEENPYWRNLNELAHLIARELGDDVLTKEASQPKIWLAEPTEDLLDEQDSVVATLRQHGFETVPRAPLPREGQEPYLRALRTCFDQAILGVQLLGGREGRMPSWSPSKSFVALQAEEADAIARVQSLPILRWRPRDLDLNRVASVEYRALLTSGSVFALGIEEFKQEVLRALRAASATPEPVKAPRFDDAPHVYVNAEPVDWDLGRRVQEALDHLGATSALPPVVSSDEPPELVRRAQQGHLEACDGVVLVYGHAPPSWVHSQWAFARRTLAQQRRSLRAAVLDGPPPEKPDLGLRGPGILALDCRSGFDLAGLGAFVGSLRSGAAHV